MKPVVITGLIVAFAAGWAAVIVFVIPGGFVVKAVICFLGALAMGVIIALALRRRWLKRLRTKEGGKQGGS